MLLLELEFKTPNVFRLALTAFLIVLAWMVEICLAHLALHERLAIFDFFPPKLLLMLLL